MNYYFEHFGAALLRQGRVEIKCVCKRTFVCGPNNTEDYLFSCPYCGDLYHLEVPTHIIRVKTNATLTLIGSRDLESWNDEK